MLERLLKRRLAALVLAWAATLAVVAGLIFADRQIALDRGKRETGAFATIVEQQTAGIFQALNHTLGAVGDAFELGHRPVKNDPEFQQMMERRLKDVPFMRAIFIVGKDGLIIHDTDYPTTPSLSLEDRPYFRMHEQDPALEGLAWPPLHSRSGTGWFIPVTRRLGQSGQFDGIVVSAIQTDYFRENFQRIGLPDAYLIALYHRDGALVSAYSARKDALDKTLEDLPLLAREERGGASFTTLVTPEQVVSYRAVDGVPLDVFVVRSKADVLAEWRQTATVTAIAMLILTIFLAWFITLTVRQSAVRAQQRERRMQAEKLQALGQLSGGIAHDFANTLHLIAMNVAILRRSPSDPSVAEKALASIERAVNGAAEVAQRLLSFARRRPLEITRLRLDAWLEASHSLLTQAAGSRVTISVECKPGLPEVLCDSAQLDMVLVNLLVNARDAMAGSGRITVRAFPCDDESGSPKAYVGNPPSHVCLVVQDNGPGMTEEVRRRACEPFYTTKGEAGTGLGLPQVYGFMKDLGGDMTIDSAPGRGTTIQLYFPVAPAGDAVRP